MASSEARVSLVPLAVDGEDRPQPPAWARGGQPSDRFWYFANAHGEPWVARRMGSTLLVSGAEVRWREIAVEADRAAALLGEILQALPVGRLTLDDGLSLSGEEALWLASVVSAAFPPPPQGRGQAPEGPAWGWARRIAEVRWPQPDEGS